ncbi:MAG: uracil-DNA glycosylase [Flavobacteriales bacterium]|nr:MAG: uracil-DNA glycosylase [Flavobacteriales bacterium]PIE49931.1 MAG: uracil-DNA glycosylase [Flavobacteriales bacterium]
MDVDIHPSWKKVLASEFDQTYFENLTKFVKKEYSQYTCFPRGSQIFEAFNQCPFEQVKVVIIGQDPYHGEGQAHGLCFSVNMGVATPPSLQNIYQELHTDLGKPIPNHGNLTHWAQQGVLLLNATLTVRKAHAGSHQGKGWEQFTDAVIKKIATQKEQVVFLLWGGYAKKKGQLIPKNNHLVLTSGHPSPLSANRGYWFGNKHFSKTNAYLEKIGKQPVNW